MENKILFIFLEIITITITFCTFCGINPPKNYNYCGNYLSLNRTHRCCYCTHNVTSETVCLILIIDKIIEEDNYPYGEYNCECNKVIEDDDLPGAPCLNHQEIVSSGDNISKEYCHSHSKDEKHPCCYYDDGNVKKCFSIGKITSKTLYTYNDFLDCFSKYHKINYLVIFFIILFFI